MATKGHRLYAPLGNTWNCWERKMDKREKKEWKTDTDRTHKCKTSTLKDRPSNGNRWNKECSRGFIKSKEKEKGQRINTIGIHINENYKGWEQLVGTFFLNWCWEGDTWNYGNCVFFVSISKHRLWKTRVGTRGKAIHNHTGNIFFRWCFSVTFASLHLHKWSTVVPSLYFNMQFDATPSMLHENEFIYVYRGSNILWPLKVGNVAYIRDLSEYTDLSIRQCAHTHTGWLMGLTLCQSDPV